MDSREARRKSRFARIQKGEEALVEECVEVRGEKKAIEDVQSFLVRFALGPRLCVAGPEKIGDVQTNYSAGNETYHPQNRSISAKVESSSRISPLSSIRNTPPCSIRANSGPRNLTSSPCSSASLNSSKEIMSGSRQRFFAMRGPEGSCEASFCGPAGEAGS